MDRKTIVKDLRARGWNGVVGKQEAIDHGYTLDSDAEWITPEPAVKPSLAKSAAVSTKATTTAAPPTPVPSKAVVNVPVKEETV